MQGKLGIVAEISVDENKKKNGSEKKEKMKNYEENKRRKDSVKTINSCLPRW